MSSAKQSYSELGSGKERSFRSYEVEVDYLQLQQVFLPNGCCRLFDFLFNRYAFDECFSHWLMALGYDFEQTEVLGLIYNEEKKRVKYLGF